MVRSTVFAMVTLALAALSMASFLVPEAAGTGHRAMSGPVLPSAGSWLERTFKVSLVNEPGLAQGNGYPASSSYEQTIAGTVHVWVNSTMECVGATFDPVSFGDDSASNSWKEAGFTTSPISSQVEGFCVNDSGSALPLPPRVAKLPSNGTTPIDVSTLPRNPSRLAAELVKERTGMPSLDQNFDYPSTKYRGFERAALLFLAPRFDDSVAFRLDLVRAIGMLPGVHGIGTVTTHSGIRGQGFMVGSGPVAQTVVVSPKTGQLLEMRNMESYACRLEWLGMTLTSFDPSPYSMSNFVYPPISTEIHLTAQWIDVMSPPALVRSNVPSTLRALGFVG